MRGLKNRWLGQCNALSRLSMEIIRSSLYSAAIALISLVIAPCALAYQPGKDGALTVNTVNTVINTYTTLNGAAAQNANTITVTSAAALTNLAVGDVLLIYNPQGATITTPNDATYGTVSALNNAGRFEFVNVDVINGNTLTIDSGGSANSCGGGLRYSYDNGAEVVRAPQYSSLTISGTGSVIAQAWNGTTGGIVAAFVQNTATVGGAGISVAGQGFRGGALINNAGSQNTNWTYYVVNSTQQGFNPPAGTGTIQGDGGAEKGESIGGSETLLDTTLNGGFGRGAPANGGGGGDSHNAGGGGGANGDNGVTWAGEGNPDNSVATYTTAWNLDGTITSAHTDAGGGRGGYTYGANTVDPTTTPPGNTAWGGNNRLERGGLGGRPLTNNPNIATARLYFGGGGGAGDENNTAGTAGGNGGGLVFLVAGTVTGAGTISANGASVGATPPGGNDGAGGGGGGGSIVVISNSLSTVVLTANGGAGGNQNIATAESEGGGGGGGGGYIAVLGGSPGSSTAGGGTNGTSNSSGLEPPKFPPNGATKGSSGIANATAPALSNFPVCNVPTLAIVKTDNGPWVAGQTNAQYTLTVKNTGSVATVGAITVSDTMPSGITPPATFTSNGWTCNFTSPTLTCTNSTAIAALSGSSAITVLVSVTAAAEPSVTNKSSVGGGGDPNNGGVPPTPGSCLAGDNHCGNDTTTVNAATSPTMTKAFSPSQIPSGGTSTLMLNFTNPNANATLTGLSVSDTFPAGLSVASPVTTTNTCGGTFTPSAGDTSLSLSGGALAAAAACSITVVVTDGTAGTAINTTGSVSTNESGTGGTASATLTVVAPPTISKVFGASSILLNGTTSLTFTINNPNATTPLTGVGVTDTLPSGLKVAAPNGLTGSCGGGTITAVAGSGSVSLSGATLATSSSCTFSVNVIGTTVGTQNNSTGNVTSTNGGQGGIATATVTVVVPQLTVTKTASPNPFVVGQPASYTVTVQNTGTATTTANITIADTLPTGITLASAVGTNWSCTGTTALSCTFTGTLATSVSTVLTLNVNVGTTATSGTNSATASGGGDPTCPATARCTGTTTTVNVIAPQLTVTKTASPNPFIVGQPASYTVTVQNTGTATTIGNITIADTLPTGITLATAVGTNWSCIGTTALSCTFTGTLATSASTTLTLNVNIGTTATSGTNSATASGGGDPTCPATARCTGTTPTVNVTAPQLTVTKTASPNPFIVGQPASYTVTVQNTGTATTIGNITIADTLPTGITLASANGTNWSCTGTTALSCTFTGTLATSASTTLTLNVTVGATATSGTNSATASGGGDPTCPVTARCTGTTTTVNVTAPQLTVAKTASPNPFVVGQPASYTVTVQNTGTATTTANITIADTLPTGITLASAVGTNWSCTGTTVLSCTFTGTLAISASTTLTLNVNVGTTATSGTNSATASGGGDPTCPATARCTGTTPTVNVIAPQLTVAKTASPNPFIVGQPASYTVTVQNTGTATTIGNITIADILPTGITLASAVGTNWRCTGTTALRCTFTGTLATSASTTLTLNVNIGTTATSGTNSATASGGGDPTCPVAARCTGTTPTVLVSASADIALAKLVDNATPNVGDTVTFTVMASNLGPSDATGVAVTDALPSGLIFQSATQSVGSYNSGTGLWTIGNLADGVSETLTIVAVVSQPGMITNTATVTASDQFDPNTSNNSAAASLNATPSADIQVNKTVDNATPNVGSDVTFTITATNAGPDAATGVVITDALPAGLSFVSATSSGTTTYSIGTGQWNIGNLGNGGSETLTITANVTQPGAITNTATKTAENEHDPVTANDQSGVTINGQQADIQVLKTVDNANPNVGDTVTFTITTTNLGPSAATGVQVTDLLPVGLNLLSSTPSMGSYNIVTGVWNIGGLAASGAGATATLTIQAQVNQAGLLTNTASKTAEDQPDPNTLNDTSSASLNGNPLADVSVTKSGPPSVTPGNNAVYTITVTDNGPSDAQAVQLSDATPPGLTFVSATAPCASGFPCNLGTVTNGQVVTITVTYAVPPSYTTPDPIVNVATATSTTPDPTNTNNTGTASTSVGSATADVSILKTGTATVTAGGTITYSLLIGNAGPSSADGTTFTDALPAGVTLVSAVCGTPTNGAACGTVTPTGNTVNGTVATLPPTGTVTITITATAPNNAVSLTNTATVAPPVGTTDPDPSNNSSSASTTVNASADLSVVKTGSATITPGNNVSYTIAVTNNGPSDAQAVQLTDSTPAGLTFVSATAPCAGGFPCALSTVTNGQVVTITVVYTVPANYAGVNPIVNTASVSSTTPDPNSGNNSSSANTNVGPGNADLSITKSGPATVNAGTSITYTLLISNSGPSPADGATYGDAVPTGVTGVAASCGSPTGGATCATPGVSGNNVTGSVPNLPSGGSVTITVTGFAPATATTLTNTATISPPANVTDPNTNNNQSSTNTNVLVAPVMADLAVTKIGPATAAPGNNVTYTIRVTNNGPNTATNVTITDPAPAGLTYVSASSPCNTGFPCNIGSLTNGQTATISNIVFSVAPNFSGTIVNTASASSDQPDPTPNNNSSSVTTVVVAAGASTPVPIDARWMLLTLIGLLAAFGVRARIRAKR